MPAAAEEAREEIEGVVMARGAVAGLLLLDAFVAVLVVDAAGFAIGEDVVGFGDGDESVVCLFIAAGFCVSIVRGTCK
jgi:hypothetical protein